MADFCRKVGDERKLRFSLCLCLVKVIKVCQAGDTGKSKPWLKHLKFTVGERRMDYDTNDSFLK